MVRQKLAQRPEHTAQPVAQPARPGSTADSWPQRDWELTLHSGRWRSPTMAVRPPESPRLEGPPGQTGGRPAAQRPQVLARTGRGAAPPVARRPRRVAGPSAGIRPAWVRPLALAGQAAGPPTTPEPPARRVVAVRRSAALLVATRNRGREPKSAPRAAVRCLQREPPASATEYCRTAAQAVTTAGAIPSASQMHPVPAARREAFRRPSGFRRSQESLQNIKHVVDQHRVDRSDHGEALERSELRIPARVFLPRRRIQTPSARSLAPSDWLSDATGTLFR